MLPVHPKPAWSGRYQLATLLGALSSLTASATLPQPAATPQHPSAFVRTIERTTPADRVRRVLYYFDTCRAVTGHPVRAFRLLDSLQAVGEQKDDPQLRRYCRYLKDTFVKHRQSPADNAALFLWVGQQAAENDDPQIAAVCRHFAGQYYFLSETYDKAFEHLLAANRAFRAIGFQHVPEISRYFYELAFNYYHFGEYEKAIHLLGEAARYPAFNDNLAIQTYNTMGMAYTQLSQVNSPGAVHQAERYYQKAQQTALFYHDTLWVGLIAGNLAGLFMQQRRWDAALAALRTDYTTGLRYGTERGMPNQTALNIATIYAHRGQWDSCGRFLQRSLVLYQQNGTNRAAAEFGRNLRDDQYWKGYYDVGRQYYQAVHNLPRAYVCLDSLNRINDRIHKRLNNRQIAMAEQKLLIQRHQLAVAAIETKNDAQRLLFWISGVVLALVALLFFLRWRFVRTKRWQDQVINAEQAKSLRFEKQIVEHELQRAKADLDVFVANLREKNALIDAITVELETLSQMQKWSREQQQIAETQQNLLDASLLTNDDWDEFRRRFERVHPHFLRQLHLQFADISPAEERLLVLSKLRIDTRQMSRMLGISPESIRKTKYRMRKRLGTDASSHLIELLADKDHEPTYA